MNFEKTFIAPHKFRQRKPLRRFEFLNLYFSQLVSLRSKCKELAFFIRKPCTFCEGDTRLFTANMQQVTIFQNFNESVKNIALSEVLQHIKCNSKLKMRIETLRKLYNEGNKTAYAQLKKSLLAFTPSGTFEGGRKADLLDTYSQYIILDIDKLDAETVQNTKATSIEIPYTLTCFTSPSGAGIKIIVEVDSKSYDHITAYNQVKAFYEAALQQCIDKSGKDVSRLCFYTYDPDIFINENHLIFEIDTDTVAEEIPFEPTPKPIIFQQKEPEYFPAFPLEKVGIGQKDLEVAYNLTSQKSNYFSGNRNNFVFLFASNCNRMGIAEIEVQAFANTTFLELTPSETRQAVASAYKHHANEFGKFKAKKAKNTNSYSENEQNQILPEQEVPLSEGFREDTSPTIPEEIFPLLPDLLREGCDIFLDLRQRDVFLSAALAILSGCTNQITGIYDGDITYTNLFNFIIAPAASGKGALKYARMLGEAYHNRLLQESLHAKRVFAAEQSIYREALNKSLKTGVAPPEEPVEPPFKTLYIPANTSSSMVMKHLNDSGGFGILCESEADTMGNSLKSEWSNYSDLLRKAFHFEPVSLSRKSSKEYVEIREPRLSVAISGTPDQVLKLIPNAENGLFSRFIFYAFSGKPTWRDVSRKAQRVSASAHFANLSKKVVEFVDFSEQSPTDFDLSDEQWQSLNTDFAQHLRATYVFQGGEATSSIKRSGIIQFRIAMLLTGLRKFEEQNTAKTTNTPITVCSDEDFYIAQTLVETYMKHAINIFEKLPKSEGGLLTNKAPNTKVAFFKALPQEFEYQAAAELAEQFKVTTRTVRNYLQGFVEAQLLNKQEHGLYQKT